jgi:CheY-like chemotaxis protein
VAARSLDLFRDAVEVASGVSPVAAVGSQITPRTPAPVGVVALKAATELNDILNALNLRVALLRHRSNPSSLPSGDMERLSGLVDKAVECVRNLQEYIRAEQLVGAIRSAIAEQQIDATDANAKHEPRMRVLLIGKERGEGSNGASIKSGLERSGCDVFVAGSAAEGLEALEHETEFDNIVCDSEILAANGWKFASEVGRAAPAAKVYLLQKDTTAQPRAAAGSRR